MSSILTRLVLASDGVSLATNDNELWLYAMTGVGLFVVGWMLTILANARRAAAARTMRHVPSDTTDDGRRSASVTRLQRDVRDWLKRTS